MDMPTAAMDMSGTTMNMDGGGGQHMSMMKMYFHVGNEESEVLFKFWSITDVGSLLYSCVICFLLAFLYEGLKYFREDLYRRHERRTSSEEKGLSNGQANGVNNNNNDNNNAQGWSASVLNSQHVVQTLLHALQFILSYLLMLIFMTYNVWLCLAVVIGATLGFFLFGWSKKSAVDLTEHCQ